ncbi:MAG: LysR family transcriptional regulator [Azoarcus sp.]|nr:LysR family transcriptional regulator [Azoarcus sp.]
MSMTMPVPPLHALVAFEALVRHGTVGRALRELGVTRAALAGSIALLEERTGLRLLVRQLPEVELTDEGRAYYDAVAVFARGTADALHSLGGDYTTEIRISASPGLARLWLVPRLEALRAACPRVAFTVSASEALSDLERSECDIAIRYCHPEELDGEASVLWAETLGILAPAARAAGFGLRSLPDLLASEPLIEHPSLPWSRLAQRIGLGALPREPDLVCHDLYAVLTACVRGEGLALLPLRLSGGFCERHGLVPVHGLRLTGKSYVLLYSAGGRARPVVHACARVLMSLATELQPAV